MVALAPAAPAEALRGRPSAPWIVLVAVVGAVIALAGGLVLQAGFERAKGHLLVHESDARLGVQFDHPVYDDVTRFLRGTDFETLEVRPPGAGQESVFESATTRYDRNIQLSVSIEHNDSAFSLDYDRDHCRAGPQSGDTSADPTIAVRSTFTFRTIHGRRAAICEQALQYPHEPDGQLQLVTQADYAFTADRIADVQIITYGKDYSAQQRSIVDAIVASVRPR